jgi:hypothetical protein
LKGSRRLEHQPVGANGQASGVILLDTIFGQHRSDGSFKQHSRNNLSTKLIDAAPFAANRDKEGRAKSGSVMG